MRHLSPVSLPDARDLVRSVFLAGQGEADGDGGGRVNAYAIGLSQTVPGSGGTLVGTSALSEADLRHP